METRYLYLDESGDPGWTRSYGGNSPYQYFVYAGIIVDASQNYRIQQELDDILDDYFGGFTLNRPDEVHYADICHGNGKYDQLSDSERSDLRDELFDLILDIEPTLTATAIDKDELKDQYGSNVYNPKSLAFRATVDRFNKHLANRDMVGTITIDSSSRGIDSQLRQLVHDAKNQGIKLGNPRRDSNVPYIMDSISMTPSEMSPGIQLADVVAYQVFNEYNHSGTSHGLDAIFHLFRDPSGRSLTEPAVFP